MDKNTVKNQWKTLARAKLNTKQNAIQYCILKAMVAKSPHKVEIARHFLHKAFTPNMKTSNPYQAIQDGSRIFNENTVILGKKASDFMTEEEITTYNKISDEVFGTPLTKYYSYFFTRQDIFEEYQLVQTAHAALELGNKLGPHQVKNLHFTCCGVENGEALEEVKAHLESRGLKYVEFREPDFGNQITSIGVYPIAENKRGDLRKYELLRFKREETIEEPEILVNLI